MHSKTYSFRSFWSAWPVPFCFLLLFTACINDQDLEYNPQLDLVPSCTDGLKNGDETTTDCGGACSDFCDESILASCSGTLSPNLVYSENDDKNISIDHVSYGWSYATNGNEYIYLNITDGSQKGINILLPQRKFASGNAKVGLGEEFTWEEANRRARIEFTDSYGDGRISISGTLYFRMEGRNKVHLEFCDVLFKNTNAYYGQAYYHYSGNINFDVTDRSFLN